VLREASRRLQTLALLGAALWILTPALGHVALYFSDPADPRWARFQIIDAIAVGSALTSLAIYLYVRTGAPSPGRVIDLGLLYMVAISFAIGVLVHWDPRPSFAPSGTAPTITWVGPIILMFAGLVPAPPGKMLAAGFAAASMDSIGMLVGHAADLYPHGGLQEALIMHYPNYLLLGAALVISRVVTGLGQQVSREREMGSYRLGELLGRGGMGEVYRATHRMLARPAAIKLIRPEVLAAGDGERAQLATVRFRREAEAAARLRSPHTVELYDFGVTEGGTLYLVMELLEGITLESLVRGHGPLPAARVVHVLRQVCDSLEEAHAAGLVHRDIKPANIHLGRVGLQHDFVKVLDFGLVKSVAGGEESLASTAGLTPGTPAYMAPELAHAEGVDGRADLYSLGCVAYFLLTGRLVFEGETAIQVMLKHLQQAPVPPSALAGQPVPRALEDLVLACLAKQPDDRPPTAAALERALGALELEPWTEEQAVAWWADTLQ
jgi:serine/threonine-protein kinase